MAIILASKSPRRQELLARMGLEFTVKASRIDEKMDPFAHPSDEVARISLAKAQAVVDSCAPEDIIISADTIVVCDGLMMGKPHSESEAVTTTLRFRALSDQEIRNYIATGEPMDKAGAYGIQGLASMFVVGLDGDYYNVMGLPICTLTVLLRRFGVKLLGC